MRHFLLGTLVTLAPLMTPGTANASCVGVAGCNNLSAQNCTQPGCSVDSISDPNTGLLKQVCRGTFSCNVFSNDQAYCNDWGNLGCSWADDTYQIGFTNNCSHPIQIVVNFSIQGQNKTLGWYQLGANQAFTTLNGAIADVRQFAYYAETTDGSHLAWQGGELANFQGRTLGMTGVTVPPGAGTENQPLSCN